MPFGFPGGLRPSGCNPSGRIPNLLVHVTC
jgi:hypothetical protein